MTDKNVKSEKNKKNKQVAEHHNLNFVTAAILCQSQDELENNKKNFENGFLVFNTDTQKLQLFYDGEFVVV